MHQLSYLSSFFVQAAFDIDQWKHSRTCYSENIKTTNVVDVQSEVMTMFMDEVVFAGLAIVGLTCLFFVGFYLAIKKDISKHGTGE